MFFSPFSSRFGGALSPHRGKGKSIWLEDGLAVVEDIGEGRGPVLKRETLTRVTHEIGCGVNSGLKMITLSYLSCKVMLTVVTSLPSHLPFHKSACM